MELIVEVGSQEAQDLAFTNGAIIVIRTDLMPVVVVPDPDPEPTPEIPLNTKLLLHCDGIPFVDSSLLSQTIINNGATLNVDCIDLSTGYLSIADSTNLRFGTNDFTIESWHKIKTVSTKHDFIACKGLPSNMNACWYFGILGGTTLCFVANSNDYNISCTYPFSSDTTNPHHLSLNRINGILYLYVDGNLVASATSQTIIENNGTMLLGAWTYSPSSTAVKGNYLDEFIITIGSALRTGNFTPTTAQFGA